MITPAQIAAMCLEGAKVEVQGSLARLSGVFTIWITFDRVQHETTAELRHAALTVPLGRHAGAIVSEETFYLPRGCTLSGAYGPTAFAIRGVQIERARQFEHRLHLLAERATSPIPFGFTTHRTNPHACEGWVKVNGELVMKIHDPEISRRLCPRL